LGNDKASILRSESVPNPCDTCGKCFSSNYQLRRHMVTHLSPKY